VSDAERLVIALDFGGIAVRAHGANTVRIEALSRGIGARGVHFDAHGGDVYIVGEAKEWVGFLQSTLSERVRARVLRSYQVEIDASPTVESERAVSGVRCISH
jgi:hypothetical protein